MPTTGLSRIRSLLKPSMDTDTTARPHIMTLLGPKSGIEESAHELGADEDADVLRETC